MAGTLCFVATPPTLNVHRIVLARGVKLCLYVCTTMLLAFALRPHVLISTMNDIFICTP